MLHNVKEKIMYFSIRQRMREYIMQKKEFEKSIVQRWPHVRIDQITHNNEPCLDKITDDTLDLLNTMCRDAERRNRWLHRINSSYRPDSKTGQHPLGRTIDIVFYIKTPGDVNVWSQYKFAKQFPWGGIGVYPFWNSPGIHVDTRQGIDHVCTWWRDASAGDHSIAEARAIFGVLI
jgi:hypothetical protein